MGTQLPGQTMSNEFRYQQQAAQQKNAKPAAKVIVPHPGDPSKGIPTGASQETKIGALNEAEAASLHDRYNGAAAIAAYRSSRSPEMQALLANAMRQSNGVDAAGNSALKASALASVNQQNATNLRALRGQQAASGVRGGVAQQLNQAARGQATQALASAERNILADNIGYKQEGLKNAVGIVGGQENIERDLAADKLGTVLGARAENAALQGAKWQAMAAGKGGGGGKKQHDEHDSGILQRVTAI